MFAPSPKDAERRRDFEEAKLVPPLKNAEGEKIERDTSLPIVDLHSLRSSLAVRLAKQNVPPMIAQRLMRHASVTTTTRHYVKLQIVDLAAAAAKAAAPSPDAANAATGTDDVRALGDAKRANTGANTPSANRRQDRAKPRGNEARDVADLIARNPGRRAYLRGTARLAAMEAAPGIEPGNNGFAIRRLTAWLRRRASC